MGFQYSYARPMTGSGRWTTSRFLTLGLLVVVALGQNHRQAPQVPATALPVSATGVCPQPLSLSAVGEASGLRDRSVKHIAVVFHGQFIHGRGPVKPVGAILPNNWTDAEGGRTWPVRFDAFLSSSTQSLEHKPCAAVDGPALCKSLNEAGGFSYSVCELRPYNGSAYIHQAHAMGLPWRDAARYSLFPHRVLSDFSTIKRALELMRTAEARGGVNYDLVAITRIDVFFYHLRILPPVAPDLSWYQSVVRARIIGRRKAHKPMWEDRFVIGTHDEMLSMTQLVAGFAGSFQRLGNQSYPEAQLYLHFQAVLQLPRRGAKTRPPFEAFAQIEGFRQNKKKFARFFIQPPPDIPVAPRFRPLPSAAPRSGGASS
jgi:hypothetical protein